MRVPLLPCLLIAIWSGSAGQAMALPALPSPQDEFVEWAHLQTEVLAAEKTGRKDLLLKSLRNLRDLQSRSDALDSALHTGLRVVGISGVSDDRLAMATDWQVLADIGRRSGNLPQAVTAAKRAVLVLKTTGDKERTGAATLDLLDLLLEAKRYAEFKHQSEDALRTFKSIGDQAGQAMVLCRQGECLIAQGRAPDALSVLHLALRKREAIQDNNGTAMILFALARANAGVSQWPAARTAMNEALQLAPKAPSTSPGLYGLCSRIDEGMGDLPSALKCERLEAALKDSLFSATMAGRMTRIQMMYGVRSKDKDLAELQGKNQALASGLGLQKLKTRIALLLCAGLTVLLLTLVLRRSWLAALARRARIKNRVIQAQARELETKSLALERQNLRLSQALVSGDAGSAENAGRQTTSGIETGLVGILTGIELEHAPDERTAQALSRLQSRVQAMALVHENLVKAGTNGKLNLKAHFTALADALFRARGLSGKMQLDLDMAGVDLPLEELLALSLLFNELLMMSAGHSGAGDAPAVISASLGNLGEHRCELLYTDAGGALSAEGMGNGSLSGGLVQALAKSLNGSIKLLKSEVMTFQLTFEPRAMMAMRMAS